MMNSTFSGFAMGPPPPGPYYCDLRQKLSSRAGDSSPEGAWSSRWRICGGDIGRDVEGFAPGGQGFEVDLQGARMASAASDQVTMNGA